MMKTWICLLLGAASLAGAEDITIGGDEYKAVKILSRTGEIVSLETDTGLVRIRIGELPEKFRRAHDMLTAADREADAAANRQAAIAAEHARAVAERARVAALTPAERAAEEAAAEAERKEQDARLTAEKEAGLKEEAASRARMAAMEGKEAAAKSAARGEPPIVFGTRLPNALTRYLKTNLKDPDSFQVAETTPALEGDYEGQPCWIIAVRYRAKNSFGGYVVRTGVGYMLRGSVLAFKHDATASATAGGDVVASPDGLGGYTIRQLPRGVSRLQSVGGAFGR